MSERAYPLPHPESGSDSRFTFGLTHAIGKLLEAAGYPPLTGADRVELMQALFRFVYEGEPPAAAGEIAAVPASAMGHGSSGSDGASKVRQIGGIQ